MPPQGFAGIKNRPAFMRGLAWAFRKASWQWNGQGSFPNTLLSLILFGMSGLCSLMYEVVWSRMLVTVMGNTAIATSTILSAFMAGLALGSFYWGRRSATRCLRPLAVFGGLEIAAGLSALLVFQCIQGILPLEVWISQITGKGYYTQIVVRFLLSFCLLLVPTFCMGGTFAVISKHLIGAQGGFGRNTALLYGINTAGALLGAFLAGFLMIKHFGHSGSIWCAAALNVAVGTCAILVGLRLRLPEARAETSSACAPAYGLPLRRTVRVVVLGIAASGFCALAYQVLWTRLLILVLDNSIYSFTIILMAFLAGIAGGSFCVAPLFRHIKDPVKLFAGIQFCLALSAFLFPFGIQQQPRTPDMSYLRFLLNTIPLSILVPTLFMGMSLPVGATIYQLWKHTAGESLGSILAANTVGAVAGAITACFLFAPRLGFRTSLLLLTGINLAIAAAVVGVHARRRYLFAAVGIMIVTGWFGITILGPDYFARTYAALEPDSRLIYYHEGLATTATIFERPDATRALYLNGIPEVATDMASIRTFKLMGALPGLLHSNPESALMITFGAGIAAATAALFVPRLECVDLADQVREIASYFAPLNDSIHTNNKLSLHIDDARHYLTNSTKTYAIIISDATHPRVYDSWVLFTRNFYDLVKQRLGPQGIFLQWVPFHGLTLEQYMAIIKTFSESFEHPSIWRIAQAHSLLLATPGPLRIDFASLCQKISEPEIRQNLQQAGLEDPFDILQCFSMSSENVKAMLAPFHQVLTDNSPANLFFPFRASFKEQYDSWPLGNSEQIRSYEESVMPYIENIGGSAEQIGKIQKALQYYEHEKSRR